MTPQEKIKLYETTKSAFKMSKRLIRNGLDHTNTINKANNLLLKCMLADSSIKDIETLNKMLIKERLRLKGNDGMSQLKIKLPTILKEAFKKDLKKKKETAVGVLIDFIKNKLR